MSNLESGNGLSYAASHAEGEYGRTFERNSVSPIPYYTRRRAQRERRYGEKNHRSSHPPDPNQVYQSGETNQDGLTEDEINQSVNRWGVVVFAKDTQKFLWVQQKVNHFYGPPKGAIQHGETGYQCAVREMREETGVEIDPTVLQGCLHLHTQTHNRGSRVYSFFLVVCAQEFTCIVDQFEIINYKWMNLLEMELKKKASFTSDLLKKLRNINTSGEKEHQINSAVKNEYDGPSSPRSVASTD